MKIKIAIAIGVILLIAGFFLSGKASPPENEIINQNNEVSVARIIVHIAGEVEYPGLYEISKDARLNDLIRLAGGFTRYADYERINLASSLNDGDFIYINIKGGNSAITNNLISINKATKEELMKLEGIGEAKALNIITYREKNGPFLRLEDLLNVSGISSTIYDKIKNLITL